MTICNDLRQAVLQAAVQGKLTERLSTDSAVDDLLASIAAEKEDLIKQKKIKKEKPLAPISDDEIPFDIPENWRWVRLSEIVKSIIAGGDKPTEFSKERGNTHQVPVISNGETNLGIMGYTTKPVITEKSLTVSGRGTIGFSVIRTEPYVPIVRLLVVLPLSQTNLEYLQLVLQTFMERGAGTAVKQLTVPMISPKIIPLPPVEEQCRIVAKVDEIMAKIDELEKTEKALEAIKADFPGDMKAAVLQAAMQGKLTKPSSSDTPVDQLLQSLRLNARPNEDEVIPDSWAWLQMKDIVKLTNGIKTSGEKLPYLEARYLRTRTNAKICDNGEIVNKGAHVILVDGENSGEVFCIPERGYMGSTFKILEVNPKINLDFVFHILLFYKDVLRQSKKGAAIPHLNKELFRNIYVPIPPIEEQQRIVEKLDALLPLCDNLGM